ncbi:hypothetical protein ACLK12_22285 [Escherichia coli]
MLYFKALLEGLSPLPSADPAIRAGIEEEAARLGWQALQRRAGCASTRWPGRGSTPMTRSRMLRALEVYRISGKTLTELTPGTGGGIALSGCSSLPSLRAIAPCAVA